MVCKLKELYQYRELIFSLIKRELRGKYKASVLGFLWTFINPLFQMLIYTIVFSLIMRSGIENFSMFLFVGLIPWNFFSISITNGASCIVNQENLVKKIYFPRIVLPIAFVTSMFINMLLTFVVILAVLLFTGFGMNLEALCYVPVIMIIEYILALGFCMLFSALTVYLRDLEYILGILTMAWMYLTPILYTIDMAPVEYQHLFRLNPMTPVIISYQQALYDQQIPEMETLLEAAVVGIAGLVIGSFVFEKMQRGFAEEL